MGAVMDSEKMQCLICKYTFASNYLLKTHMNEHFANYTCEECGKTWATMQRLKEHKRRAHQMGSFKCPDCDEVLQNRGKFIAHRTNKHIGKTNVCPLCKKRFQSFYSRQKHLRDVHGDYAGHKCKVCNVVLLTSAALNSHIVKHDTRKYSCVYCDKIFKRKKGFICHLNIHKGQTRFECSICDKAYDRKNSLRAHIVNVHMKCNIKKPICSVCNKVYASGGSLYQHMKIHMNINGKKNYECSICKKAYSSKGALTQHVKQIHFPGQRLECSICNKTFIKKGNLTEHMKTHMNIRNFSCQHCNVAFIQKSTLTKHLKTHERDLVSKNDDNNMLDDQEYII